MKINRYNISKPNKYVDKQGNEKTNWNNVGSMTEFIKDDGNISRIIEIPAIGLKANIYPFQPKGERRSQSDSQETSELAEQINNPSAEYGDLPF